MGERSNKKIKTRFKIDFDKAKKELTKEGYGIVGNNSAVKSCLWTKKSLKGEGGCWKQKFYGIESHRCAQITCSLFNCDNKCLHCWRNLSYTNSGKIENPDDPKTILDEIIKARKKLMTGHGGDKNVPRKKYLESLEPTLFTLSLSGEPTIYPKLSELIKEIRKRKAISFIVSNGQHPEMIKKLEKQKALPTQLTISMNAPNEKLFKTWHNSKNKDAWKRFNKTLDLIKKLKGKTRRAIRLTLVKELFAGTKLDKITNMSDKNVKEYADLIKKADPDFIHIKGFKSLGYSRKRLQYDKQPFHPEVKDFTKKLLKELQTWDKDWKIQGEVERSCVFLLSRLDKKDLKIKKKQI